MAGRAELVITTFDLPEPRKQRYGLRPRNHQLLREAERCSALEIGNGMRGCAIAARLAAVDAGVSGEELRDVKIALVTMQRLGAELARRLTPSGLDVVEASGGPVDIEPALEKL